MFSGPEVIANRRVNRLVRLGPIVLRQLDIARLSNAGRYRLISLPLLRSSIGWRCDAEDDTSPRSMLDVKHLGRVQGTS